MATTFGYSCKNSRSKESGTLWLIAPTGAGVTRGRQASSCSIQPVRTAGAAKVTAADSRPVRPVYAGIEITCQGIVGKGVYNTVTMGEPPPGGWQMESGAGVAARSGGSNAP